jgi:hypothetical protein
MKKTAVEWLIDEIKFARHLCDDPSLEMDIWHTLDVLIAKGEEAKEMEKEQMEKVWDDSRDADFGDNDFRTQKSFKQYYEETFNTNER